MLVPNFCGGTYQTLSPVFAADTAVNVFVETREVPGSAKQITMYGTPGLVSVEDVNEHGCRGWFSQDGRTFVVVGGKLYEFNPIDDTTAEIGTITDDGYPVSFASNGAGGDQLGIVGGGALKVFDLVTNILSAAIVLPFTGPVMMVFMDGYGLINQVDSPIVWFSALEDFTSWDALDFFARSNTSDNLLALAVTRDRCWTFGSKTTTQFYNSGDADTPFLPYPGTTMQIGIETPWCLLVYQDVCYWIGQSASGGARVWRASDPSATPISTPPIELWLSQLQSFDRLEGLVYEQAGHPFVIWSCIDSPDDVQTYGYDLRESLWHARGYWNENVGQYERWRLRGSVTVGNRVFGGDSETNTLYELSLTTYTDDGTLIRRERTAPYISAENQFLFLDQVELGIAAGEGLSTGQGSAPVAMLEISRDGGRTWVSAGTGTLGAQGEYDARAIWRRLGRTRSDRLVLRVVQTDPTPCIWGPGLWLRATNGSGAL